MIDAYGYGLSLKRFLVVTFWRLFCNHKQAKFYACTGAQRWDKDNVTVGVSFVCPRCKKTWAGDIVAGLGCKKQELFNHSFGQGE
jgi:hypothetical protein